MKLHKQLTFLLVLTLKFLSCDNASPTEIKPRNISKTANLNMTDVSQSNIKGNENRNTFNPALRDSDSILVDVLGLFKWGALKEADVSSLVNNDIYNNYPLDMYNNDYVFLEDVRKPAENFKGADVKLLGGKFKRIWNGQKYNTVNDGARRLDELNGHFLDYTISPETSNSVINTNAQQEKKKADMVSMPWTEDHDILNTENTIYEAGYLPEVTKRNNNAQSSCTLDATHTSLTFSENFETGDGVVVLVCQGNVLVNKCEGMCNSTVLPDVNHYDGYKKVKVFARQVLVTQLNNSSCVVVIRVNSACRSVYG